MDCDSGQHLGDVTENGVVTFDDVIDDWSQVCKRDITDMMLPSDAEYLTLTFHVKALKDPGIFRVCPTQRIVGRFEDWWLIT